MIKQIVQELNINGKEVIEYSIKNEKIEVRFLNVAGAITKIALAEDDFEKNLVLNYADYEDYFANGCYLNSIIGRTSNRIAHGKFELGGKEIQLDINGAPHNLHGGEQNLTNTIFEVGQTNDGYALSTIMPHQEDGFPGNLNVTVYYTLAGSSLNIKYEATTDKTTIVNLTQHAYFNLSGDLERTIYDHELVIKAPHVAEVDETSGFTEKLIPVEGTRFDFNSANIVNPEGREPHYLFDYTTGYDHLYILDADAKEVVKFKDLPSGRTLKITTTEPAMQFYASNYVTDELVFENDRKGEIHLGACFETHQIPFDYDSQILNPGEVYSQVTNFEFGVE